MKEPEAKAESLFVRALDLPPGGARDALVNQRRQLAQLLIDKPQELVCAQGRLRSRSLVRRTGTAHARY